MAVFQYASRINGKLPQAFTGSIVSAINSITRAFGSSVTAEGVESKKVANELVESGCNDLQGYHLPSPFTSQAATEALLDNRDLLLKLDGKAA